MINIKKILIKNFAKTGNSQLMLMLIRKAEENNYILFLYFFLAGAILKSVYLFASYMWGVDLFFYVEGAEKMHYGGVLYKDFGDIKPPAIFSLYYILIKCSGYGHIFQAIKVIVMIFQASTAYLVFKIIKSLYGRSYGITAGFMFLILISADWNLWSANVMLLCLLPLFASIYFLVKDDFSFSPASLFLCGAFTGIACLFSTNLLLYTPLSVILTFWFTQSIKKTLTNGLITFIGFMIPLGVFIGYLFIHDAIKDYWWWGIEWAQVYSNSRSLGNRLYYFFANSFVQMWEWLPAMLYSGAGIYLLFRQDIRMVNFKKRSVFSLLIFIVSFLSFFILGKVMPRYYLYLLPCILILVPRAFSMHRFIHVFCGIILLTGLFYNCYISVKNPYDRVTFFPNEPVIQMIKNNSNQDDKIFVWPEGYEFYHASGRSMATSFFSPGQHLAETLIWEKDEYRHIDIPWQKFLGEFDRDRPQLVIDLSGSFNNMGNLQPGARLVSYKNIFINNIASNYTLLAVINGIVIYKRLP